jgi:hypothetical protein
MAFILGDRVFETSTTTGTGSFTLLGNQLGFRTFLAGVGASNTTMYSAANAGLTEWEVGVGTLDAGGTTLARSTVISSSNAGSLVNFSAGIKNVFCDIPASKLVYIDPQGNTQPTLVNTVLANPAITGGNINSTNINSLINLLLVGI